MAKMTLLDMVQDILSDMDSDEVNSINDTVEAQQVAQIIKTTYYEIIDSRDWPHLHKVGTLTQAGSSTPTHFQIPETVQRVDWIKYNKRLSTDTKDKYEDITYMEPKNFIDLVMSRDSSSSSVDTILDIDNTNLFILNDKSPTYWTSLDDEYIIFDSYDSAVDSPMMESKLRAGIYQNVSWSGLDTDTPNLPSKAFSYLLAESKSVCFEKLKQVANAKEEQRSRRQRTRLAREKFRTNGGIKYPDYGRRSKK